MPLREGECLLRVNEEPLDDQWTLRTQMRRDLLWVFLRSFPLKLYLNVNYFLKDKRTFTEVSLTPEPVFSICQKLVLLKPYPKHIATL